MPLYFCLLTATTGEAHSFASAADAIALSRTTCAPQANIGLDSGVDDRGAGNDFRLTRIVYMPTGVTHWNDPSGYDADIQQYLRKAELYNIPSFAQAWRQRAAPKISSSTAIVSSSARRAQLWNTEKTSIASCNTVRYFTTLSSPSLVARRSFSIFQLPASLSFACAVRARMKRTLRTWCSQNFGQSGCSVYMDGTASIVVLTIVTRFAKEVDCAPENRFQIRVTHTFVESIGAQKKFAPLTSPSVHALEPARSQNFDVKGVIRLRTSDSLGSVLVCGLDNIAYDLNRGPWEGITLFEFSTTV
ncbi:hypothetical protein DFH06DRAFT_1435543 [Mycena polygramma]|nr:hypothetical protein DFH06DRAFT_1435543 [Mycena polygramma]